MTLSQWMRLCSRWGKKMRRWEEEKYQMQADQMCQTALKTLTSMRELVLLKHKITWKIKKQVWNWRNSHWSHSFRVISWQIWALLTKLNVYIDSLFCALEGKNPSPLLWHLNEGESCFCFAAPGMLAYPLAYIIPPLHSGEEEKHQQWGGEGGQVVKFPLAISTLPPSGWLFHKLRFDNRSGPRGRLTGCQLRQQPFSHVCLLLDQEVTRAARRPDFILLMQMHVKNRANEWEQREPWIPGYPLFFHHLNNDMSSR